MPKTGHLRYDLQIAGIIIWVLFVGLEFKFIDLLKLLHWNKIGWNILI